MLRIPNLADVLPSSDQDFLYLSNVSPKDKPWDKHRSESDLVSKSYRFLEYDSYAQRIENCSRYLEFVLRPDVHGQVKFKLNHAFFCRVRFCPVCQWRRSLKWRARILEAVPKLLASYPSHRFIFLTLTVQNCPLEELRANVTHINKSWGRLVKRSKFPAVGWLKSLEVTRGRDGNAHPHLHVMLMVKASYFKGTNYLSQKRWSELWKSCLRVDYQPVVDIRLVKPKSGSSENSVTVYMSGVKKAIVEVVKYSVKEADLTDDPLWLKGLTNQLHKTRSVAVGGVFKDYMSSKEPEDLVHTDLEEDETLDEIAKAYFAWVQKVKRYKSINFLTEEETT